jgi:protein tyrosine/serine phosphatase
MFKGDIGTTRGRAAAWSDSLFVDHSVFRLVWSNWSEVAPGRLYRCNHPTAWRIAAAQRRLGIKTVINLRGHRACGSDALSREAAAKLGLRHIDMAFESRGAPHRDRILRFHDICQTLVEPALMHCKSGADRTGLAAGLFLIFNGGSSRDALNQLSWRFGHWSRSRFLKPASPPASWHPIRCRHAPPSGCSNSGTNCKPISPVPATASSRASASANR